MEKNALTKRLTLIGWIVSAAVVLLLGLGAWLGYHQYRLIERALQVRAQGLDVWDLSQLQRQLLIFENAVTGVATTGRVAEPPQLGLKWDLVWSRVNVIRQGDTGKALRAMPVANAKLTRIETLLTTIDGSYADLVKHPAANAPKVLEQLEQAIRESQELYGTVYNASVGRQVKLRETLKSVQILTIAIGALFAVLVGVLLLVVWRNLDTRLGDAYRLMGELRHSEERFRNLVEGSIQGVLIHRAGKPLFANQTFASIFGYESPAEVIARGSTDAFTAPAERERLRAHYDAHLRGEPAPERYEFQGVRRDGSLIWLENFVRVVRWEGAPAAQSTLYDITDRKRAEVQLRASQRLLQSVIDTLPQWITVKDCEDNYLLVNDAMAEAHGVRVAEFLTRPAAATPELFPGAREQTRSLDRRVLSSGQPVELPQCTYRRPDGGNETRRMIKFPLREESGRITGIIGWSEDITERQRHEEALREAKDSAERANRLKDKFVSLIAHDLRAPIGSMRLMLDLLEGEGQDGESQRELRRAVSEKCDYLMAMIDELLKISRLQSGTLRPERRFVNAAQVTASVYELKPLAEKKGVHLVNRIPEHLRLYADPDLMREVVQNLVGNAIKFSRRGDTVTLFAPPERETTIAVQDTGTGIAPNLVADLFRHEVKTTTAGTDGERGTGLGLPLCHDIMHAHGGSLHVETEPGRGSVFYVELPPTRPRALVVLRDPRTLEQVRAQLAAIDVEVLVAHSVEQAWSCLSESRPHLVIVDLPALGSQGYPFLEALKRDGTSRDIPVIVTSARPEMVTREAALRLGADDFVPGPLDESELIARVRRFVG